MNRAILAACALAWSVAAQAQQVKIEGGEASPKDSGEPKTLAQQIREALDGQARPTLKLRPAPDKEATPEQKKERDKIQKLRSRDYGKQLGRPVAKAPPARPVVVKKAPAPKPAPAPARELASWGYGEADGPARWASLDPAYALCAQGKAQSPIHIETDKTLLGPADEVEFHWGRAKGWMSAPRGALELELAPGQGWILARGQRYEVRGAWLSTPSEQRINFKGSPMGIEWRAVSDEGAVAIVAVDVEEGAPNPAVEAMLRAIPLSPTDKAGLGAGLDLGDLVPAPGHRKHIQYMGSLPRPPCSEGALWVVMREKIQASAAQIQSLGKLYPQTARPVQPVNGRMVREQQ